MPNYDRHLQRATGKIVYTKKIASDNIELITKALDFEGGYKNDQKYASIPGVNAGYNSNSFFRGAIEYMRMADQVIILNASKPLGFQRFWKYQLLPPDQADSPPGAILRQTAGIRLPYQIR